MFIGPFQAVGLYSKDGEHVPLVKPIQCVGQVEGWLNALAECMCSSLRSLLQDAVAIMDGLASTFASCGTQKAAPTTDRARRYEGADHAPEQHSSQQLPTATGVSTQKMPLVGVPGSRPPINAQQYCVTACNR